jgi:hypothetical protein
MLLDHFDGILNYCVSFRQGCMTAVRDS